MIRKKIERVYVKAGQIEYKNIEKVIKRNVPSEASIIDVGSGLCSFANYFVKKFPKASFQCVDISKELVDIALSYNFNAELGNITTLPFEDESFNVVHCSHVIEHLKYPDVIKAIDELIRVCKTDGIIIIRTPLRVNHRFYNDIDHIRPYPPDAILNYFKNEQQQVKGKYDVQELTRWYTRVYFEFDYNRFPFKLIKFSNIILKLLWLFIGFPKDRTNNYGIVLKKASSSLKSH